MALKKDFHEEKSPLLIRSFNNAFEIQIFGRSAKSLIFDYVTLSLLTFIGVLLLGRIYPFNEIYAWTIRENWAFIQFFFIPVVVPIFVVGLVKRDGTSFWRYVAISITDLLTESRFEPFNETPIWKRVFRRGE